MTYIDYEPRFRRKAQIAGFSEEQIIKCLTYAKPLLDQNLPVIYNTSNLSALVGYKTTYLKRAVAFTPYFYRKFSIRKKNGSTRQINEPLPSLKEIQSWILHNILEKVPVSKFSKAYIKGRNLIDNVRYHRNKDYVLCLDLRDFFPSIRTSDVEGIFLRLGYSSNLSNLLAKLCSLNGALSQGAPTSPCISNIFMKPFDEHIGSFCTEHNIRYSRYADDLTFSFSQSKLDLEKLILQKVKSELQSLSDRFVLNESKTKVFKRSDRQIVTGIVVNEVIQTPKDYRKKIRQEVFYIKKFGLRSHLQQTNNNKGNYLNHLLGKINFALSVNKNDNEILQYKHFVIELLKQDA